jgi:hypothetical protein
MVWTSALAAMLNFDLEGRWVVLTTSVIRLLGTVSTPASEDLV